MIGLDKVGEEGREAWGVGFVKALDDHSVQVDQKGHRPGEENVRPKGSWVKLTPICSWDADFDVHGCWYASQRMTSWLRTD